MKSGSLRSMPGPPKVTTACGTSIGNDDAAAESWRGRLGHRLEIVLRRQRGEGAVDQLAGGRGVDVADDGNRQPVAREYAGNIVAHVGGGDARHRLQRAAALEAVGVTGKGGRPPVAAGDVVGAGGGAAQRRQLLAAHALDRLGVETRRGQRQMQHVKGLVAVFVERAQRAVEIVAADAEADLDGAAFQTSRGRSCRRDRRRPRRAGWRRDWRRRIWRPRPGWSRPGRQN